MNDTVKKWGAIGGIGFAAFAAGFALKSITGHTTAPVPSTSENKSQGAASSAKSGNKAAINPALTVSTFSPTQTNLPLSLSANGSIQPWQESSIGAEVSGLKLQSVLVNVGDWVEKGQLLAVYDNNAVNANVEQLQANVDEAVAAADEAERDAQRMSQLKGTGAVSEQQIAQALTAAKTAKARVQALKASLHVQHIQKNNTDVRAPDSGIISARTATVGAVSGAGMELFKLIRQGRLEWRAEVTADDINKIKIGDTAQITKEDGTTIAGVVRTVGATVDAQSRAAIVYVDVPRSSVSGKTVSGMYAKGVFNLGASSALAVPQQAVVQRDGFSYVFTLNADNTVSQVHITTGRRMGDSIEVLDMLSATDRIVAKGTGFLKDGDTVKVVNNTGGSAAQPIVHASTQ